MAAPIENVEVRLNIANKGKGLFTTKNVKEDDVLFEEGPLVSCQFLWNQFYKYTACDFCMSSLETAQQMARRLSGNYELVLPYPECCVVKPELQCRCDSCGIEYCSSDCRERARQSYHSTLCMGQSAEDQDHPINRLKDAWRQSHYPPETSSIMLLARMVACVTQSKNKDKLLSQFSEFCKATVHEEEQIAHKLLGQTFQDQITLLRELSVEALCTDHVHQWFTPEGFKSIIAMIGTNGQGIGSSSLSVWVKNCDDLDVDDDTRKQLDHFIDKLYEDLEKESGQFLNCEGSGLYTLQSACNHSCEPNAEVTFPHNNNVLAVRALKDIAEGEEVCISYLDDCQLNRSRHSRQKALRENYIFLCSCPKCIAQADDPDVTSEEEDDDEEDMDDL